MLVLILWLAVDATVTFVVNAVAMVVVVAVVVFVQINKAQDLFNAGWHRAK